MNLIVGFVRFIVALLSICGLADAAETVTIGNSKAVLLRPEEAVGSVILFPGGDGIISPGPNGTITRLSNNQLVRTRDAYVARRLAVLVVDAGVDLAAAVEFMAGIKQSVTVIATSRGTLRAAQGIARGARPDALVLSSGLLTSASGSSENVASILRSPSLLPRTLVIHHRNDRCHVSLPFGVEPFIRWANGKANAVWLDGGISTGDPCRALAYHGFNGIDDQVVTLAAEFR
jgi:hypothetical protein